MPTRWRNSRMAIALSCSSGLPSTGSAPSWNTSSPLMQRSSVLLPEPLLPMMAMTSPRLTVRSMPLSTSFVPYDFRSAVIWTIGPALAMDAARFVAGVGAMAEPSATLDIEFSFKVLGKQADRETQREIEQRNAGEHHERLKG